MPITIENSAVVEGSWGDVDKTALGNELYDNGNAEVIREAYLFVGDLEKVSTWKFPHHVVEDGVLKVHRSGVHAAAQRLVAGGETETDIPKRTAARHLLRHYRMLGEEPPASLVELSKFLNKEEAIEELKILYSLILEDEELVGILSEIPEIEEEIGWLPDSFEESLEEKITEASITTDTEEELVVEELQEKEIKEENNSSRSIKDIILSKGIKNITVCDDERTLVVKQNIRFSNKGKTKKEDYYASAEELEKIRVYSLVDLEAEDVLVFSVHAADMQIDRGYEHFSDKALRKMAQLSVGKAFLLDHDWETDSEVGTIFDAAVVDGKLMQKVYILNADFNERLIKNILGGIHSRVSVGFASNVNDMLCDSCNKRSSKKAVSIFDEDSCTHMPGLEDEEGMKTTVTIDNVVDYYEVSIVAVPAQRDAGIRRKEANKVEDVSIKYFSSISTTRPIELKTSAKIVEDLKQILNSSLTSEEKELEISIKNENPSLTIIEEAIENIDNKENNKHSDTINNDNLNFGVPDLPENEEITKVSSDSLSDIVNSLKTVVESLQETVQKSIEAAEALSLANQERAKQLEEAIKEQEDRLSFLTELTEKASEQTIKALEAKATKMSEKGSNSNWAEELYNQLSSSLGGQ